MPLPFKLKNFNTFEGADSYAGKSASVRLPTLARKMLEYRAGGMSGPVKSDMGSEAMDTEIVMYEYSKKLLAKWGIQTIDGVELRFRGAAVNDEIDDAVDGIEVIMRGRYSEIGFDEAKAGEESNMKLKGEIVYLRYELNGIPIIEIDHINMVELIDGVDRLALQREALAI